MYTYKYSKKVSKFLRSRDKKFLKSFYEKLSEITKNPFNPQVDVQPLSGSDDSFRLRIGKYRILYTIQENEILIYFYDANTRGDIYKKY